MSSAAVGGYLTTVFGPELGGGAGEALAVAGEEAIDFIEQREQSRVVRTLVQVHEEVMHRVTDGDVLRGVISDPEGREAAAIFEAVVDAAARSSEERKCEVIANLYASVAFDESVDVGDVLLYVRRVRDSSWRQLVAVQYFEDRFRAGEGIDVVVARRVIRGQPALGAELIALREALGLLSFGEEREEILAAWEDMPDGFASAGPQVVHLTGLGRALHKLGRIAGAISSQDLEAFANEARL